MTVHDAEQPRRILTYDGRLGELYRIFLLNLLLTIVTVGIWRFWAVTRMRRYVWSRTSSLGDRFEYDGTGGQLFLGWLLAVGVLIGLVLVAVVLGILLRGAGPVALVLPVLAIYPVVFVLALGAPFSAQRYRLGHTVWRGIRGGMQGSMIAYGLCSALYFLASILSLFQLLPWMALRLYERRVNASFLGNQRFAARGRALAVYLWFLGAFVGFVVLAIAVFGVFGFLERDNLALLVMRDPNLAPMMMRKVLLPLLLAYLVLAVGGALISCGYTAAFYRHATSHTTLGSLRFGSDVTAAGVLGLVLGNVVILIVTLGFGMPIIIQRNMRFSTAHLLATGSIDLGRLLQSEQPVSRYGEGMFQALDAGTGIG